MVEVVPAAPAATPGASRRKLIGASIGGGIVGALWTTGMSILAQGRHPQVFVVGNDGWQVILVEHESHRMLLLVGEFDRSPEPEIDLLCGLLRQRIDLLVGSQASLSRLSSGFRRRRNVTLLVQVGAAPSGAASPAFLPLTGAAGFRLGDLAIQIHAIPVQAESNERAIAWTCLVESDDIQIAVAPSLNDISVHGAPASAMAIAPEGDIRSLQQVLPGIAIATNAGSTSDLGSDPASGENSGRTFQLVRVFPEDVSRFEFKHDRLHIPSWAQTLTLAVG